MTPNVDERLASVIRALTEVILPHLPPEAGLAQEQVHLAVGHLQILRAQLDAVPAYEREELDDALAIAAALGRISGGAQTTTAGAALQSVARAADGSDVRGQRQAIHDAVDGLVRAVAADGGPDDKATTARIILAHEQARTQKDRQWFAPFGFDTI